MKRDRTEWVLMGLLTLGTVAQVALFIQMVAAH